MKNIICLFISLLFIISFNNSAACTVFYAANGKIVLAGNNEDFLNAEAYIHFLPAKDGKFGRIYFGYYVLGSLIPFGGVNDRGLFYDMASLDNVELKEIPTGEIFNGDIIEIIMTECSTIDEVIKLLNKYSNISYLTNVQIMFGDKFGNSIIVEGNKIHQKEGGYQIMTNFRQTTENLKKGNIPCQRYKIADNLLGRTNNLSKRLFQNILESVHQEGYYSTVYSNIYDLTNGVVYLYYFHNFFDEVRLDIGNELSKGERIVKINSLFKENFAAQGFIDWKNGELNNRIQARLAKNFNPDIINNFTGNYGITFYPTNDTVKVSNENGKIVFVIADTLRIEAMPESNTKYFKATLNGDYDFTFNIAEAENKIYLKIRPTEFGTETIWVKNIDRSSF